MAASDLIADVQDVIQDDAYGEDEIMPLLNRAMTLISNKVLLPELEAYADITTVANTQSVALPANYHRELFKVKSAVYKDIPIFTSPARLFDACGLALEGMAGDVQAVAITPGQTLFLYKVPSTAQTLTVWYFRKPLDMAADVDDPDGLPEQFHDMLSNFACWKLFDKIEDGIEGKKVNADHYMGLWLDALTIGLPSFVEGLGVSRRKAPTVRGEFL